MFDKVFAICGKDFFAVCRYNRDIKIKEISMMDTKKVGLFLKQLRKENNMTQEQLGEKIGVTNKTVSRWETAIICRRLNAWEC